MLAFYIFDIDIINSPSTRGLSCNHLRLLGSVSASVQMLLGSKSIDCHNEHEFLTLLTCGFAYIICCEIIAFLNLYLCGSVYVMVVFVCEQLQMHMLKCDFADLEENVTVSPC